MEAYTATIVRNAERPYGLDYIKDSDGVPHCECGGIVKPDVVLYGENLNDGIMAKAAKGTP